MNILEIIGTHINTFIFIAGLIETGCLFVNGIELSNKKSRIEETLGRRNNKYIKNVITHEIEEEEDKNAAITPDTIRAYETDFNVSCSFHSVLVQLIPIFPLLGIFGTVGGLLSPLQTMATNHAADLEAMMSSLGTALWSTFLGLAFAMLLKFIDAVFPSRIINKAEIMLDDFDKKLSIAEMFQNFKNEK